MAGRQPDVVISSHGGDCPEQWEGSVDGRGFYFRERGGDWRIELEAGTGVKADRDWDVIAEGSTGAAGYGDSPVQRAAFIVDTIRVHLTRQSCTHGGIDPGALASVFGDQLRWCPNCGARLVPFS